VISHAGGCALIMTLLCASPSFAAGANDAFTQQQGSTQTPPAGSDQKPSTPDAREHENKDENKDKNKDENDDLAKLPGATPAPATNESPTPTGDVGRHRVYLENAVVVGAQRAELTVPSDAPANSWQERLFIDVRKEWSLGHRLNVTFGDRLNMRADSDLVFPSHQNVINDFREGFLSWEPVDRTYVDAGRINLKSGAALGFNPTDFFKTRAVVEPLSADPSVLREDRLGALMLRAQRIGSAGAITVAFAPALYQQSPVYTNSSLPSLDPSFDRTNAHTRLLVKASMNVAADFSPELLVYHENDRTKLGVNITRGLGQNIVAYAEWAGGRQPSMIADALRYGRETGALPADAPPVLGDDSRRVFQSDLSVGGSFAAKAKVTLNVEYHLHQAGFVRQDWDNWFNTGQGTVGSSPVARELWFIRGYALDQQLPLTRHSLFARADWVDAFARHLELTGFVNTDLYDRSGLVQIAADYYLSDTWTIGVQANANVGSARSDFGSLPGTGSMLFKAARYFR
jgi:hypothetical protein